MKLFLSILTTICLYSNVLIGQNLISAELLQSYDIPELTQLAADNGVPSIVLAPEFEMDYYRVTYETQHPLTGTIIATGGMAVPKNISCAVPIASYQHGTSTNDLGVPGYQSTESLIGILLGSTGYVVILPDYIGLGGSPGMHPYVHADTEALAVIDMIRATREFEMNDPVRLNDQIFLFGYSQGGHATMAAHKTIQEEYADEMWVTASNPMSGPYDVSGVQTATIIADVPYATPSYLPYVMIGYNSVYGTLYNHPSEVFTSPYDETIPPLFDGTYSTGYVNSQCADIPNQMIKPSVLDSFINYPETHFFRVALKDNDVYEWIPESPVRMVYCTGDEQVIYTNALVAQQYFEDQGVTITESIQLGEGNHNDCVTPALLTGIQYFNGFKTADNGLVVSSIITPSNGTDGSISITVENDPGNLEITWSNGATNVYEISNLTPGPYSVQVTDDFGCTQTHEFEVSMPSNTNNLTINSLNIFPNPSTGLFNIDTPINETSGVISAFTLDGKKIAMHVVGTESENTLLDLTNFSSGTYLIEFKGIEIHQSRVVVSK